jgi:hypothetical protein
MAPQIDRQAIAIIDVLTPADPKRKADHSRNGTREYRSAGETLFPGVTKMRYAKRTNVANSAPPSR